MTSRFNSSINFHGGNVREQARQLGVQPNQLLDASASIVPFSPPSKLKGCLRKALANESLRNYPDCSHLSLREAIGNWHGVSSEMVLPGNGSSELFTWAARDAGFQGLNGLPSPGFSDYLRALKCWNIPHVHLTLPSTWSNKAPQAFPLRPETNVIWITNPHNPTGQLWSKESLENLIKNHSLVICDEAFLPLVPNGEEQSLLPLVFKYPNLIVIRSLTKLFALAGLRLGYAISRPERFKNWIEWRDPWPLNGLAIAAGIHLMTNTSELKQWIEKIQSWVSREGDWLTSQLQKIPGIDPLPSSANFLLIRGDCSLTSLKEELANRHVIVRDCRSFPELGECYLRISLQSRSGNRRIISALKNILK